jgi:hypothetical protein
MSWIQEELKERMDSTGTSSGYFKLKDGKNTVTLDISKAPTKRLVEMDGKKRDYHDYLCLDDANLGKVFSATGFLHSLIIKELTDYAEKNCSIAVLEIRVEHPTPTKTSYVVIAREVK